MTVDKKIKGFTLKERKDLFEKLVAYFDSNNADIKKRTISYQPTEPFTSNSFNSMEKEEKIDAYLSMSPKILLLALNHHYESGEILDSYQKFDLECLIQAIKRSSIDASQLFTEAEEQRKLNGPFRLDNHPDHGFGIHIFWKLKLGISKFQNGLHWRIIGGE